MDIVLWIQKSMIFEMMYFENTKLKRQQFWLLKRAELL